MSKPTPIELLPTFERVSKLLSLDDGTGKLIRIVTTSQNARAGQEAGSLKNSGYRDVKIDGRLIRAHRIVWLLNTGAWPKAEIDHINGVRDDNRPENLRDVSTSQNQQNQKKARRDNKSTSTVPGCFFEPSSGKWMANCMLNGKRAIKRRFSNQAEAEACVLEFRSKWFPANTLPATVAEHYMKGGNV